MPPRRNGNKGDLRWWHAARIPSHTKLTVDARATALVPNSASPRGLLFVSPRGLHTNILMQLNAARWLASRLNKTLVVPFCPSEEALGECVDGSGEVAMASTAVYMNTTSVWQSESLGGCEHERQVVLLHDALRDGREVTCLGESSKACVSELSADSQLLRGLTVRWLVRTDAWDHLRRDVQGTWRPPFHVPAGDVYVPHIFRLGMNRSSLAGSTQTFDLCPLRPQLTARAAADAQALRGSLPKRFVCMHWRAGDFISHMEPKHRGLTNGTRMAVLASLAARTVGASHVLLLTNAGLKDARTERLHMQWQQKTPSLWPRERDPLEILKRLISALRSRQIQLTVRSGCSSTPPDVEKHVCAKANALILSAGSTFSQHILALARDIGHGKPPPMLSLGERRLPRLFRPYFTEM